MSVIFSRRSFLTTLAACASHERQADSQTEVMVATLRRASRAQQAVYFVGEACFCWRDTNLLGELDGAEPLRGVAILAVERGASRETWGDILPEYAHAELMIPIQPRRRRVRLRPQGVALIVAADHLFAELPKDRGGLKATLSEVAFAHAELSGFSPVIVHAEATPLPLKAGFAWSAHSDGGIAIQVHNDFEGSAPWLLNAALGDLLRHLGNGEARMILQ